jgi:hypothetical protein
MVKFVSNQKEEKWLKQLKKLFKKINNNKYIIYCLNILACLYSELNYENYNITRIIFCNIYVTCNYSMNY